MQSQLAICVFAESALADSLQEVLGRDRYRCELFDAPDQFLHYIEQHKDSTDCLIVQNTRSTPAILGRLVERGLLLPVALIEPATPCAERQPETQSAEPRAAAANPASYLYHPGEVWLPSAQLAQLSATIERAIAHFLKLPLHPLDERATPQFIGNPVDLHPAQRHLSHQQRRLADKLKERLGYLGIYYKRNPGDFFRHLQTAEKEQLLALLREDYREVILNYFLDDYPLNQAIDKLVNQAFFADLSVSQILEIHMQLMDEFAQQLKLEGRSDDILMDYRLALIDIIAHLCEMYRRSIPREDIPYEVLARDE